MTTKYIARYNGQIVGTRKSEITHKTYSHAVVIWGHGRDPYAKTWCSRLDLAQGQARQYRNWGFQTAIVDAEIVTPKVIKIRDQAHYDSLTEAGVSPLKIEG